MLSFTVNNTKLPNVMSLISLIQGYSNTPETALGLVI